MRRCSIFGDAKCVLCQSNPPPEHAHYTTPGEPFDTDSCRWDVANPHQDTTNNSIKACDQGYELTAAPILPALSYFRLAVCRLPAGTLKVP